MNDRPIYMYCYNEQDLLRAQEQKPDYLILMNDITLPNGIIIDWNCTITSKPGPELFACLEHDIDDIIREMEQAMKVPPMAAVWAALKLMNGDDHEEQEKD